SSGFNYKFVNTSDADVVTGDSTGRKTMVTVIERQMNHPLEDCGPLLKLVHYGPPRWKDSIWKGSLSNILFNPDPDHLTLASGRLAPL
ncbi:hypothetical protein L082_14049, partial [Escherichia coli SHECO001]